MLQNYLCSGKFQISKIKQKIKAFLARFTALFSCSREAAMPTIAQNVTPNTDQENESLSSSIENVRRAACNAMAMHIDGTTKESKKRERRERFSDAEKVELVFLSIDRAEAALNLVDEVALYLSSGSNSGSNSGCSLAVDALKLALSAGRKQFVQI